MSQQNVRETAPLGFDNEGWPLPEARSLMIDNFTQSWIRRWYVVLATFCVTVFLIGFAALLVTPRWEGYCTAQIVNNQNPSPRVTNIGLSPAGVLDAETTANNLIDLAKSRPLLLQVIRDLNLAQHFKDKAESGAWQEEVKQAIGYIAKLKFLRKTAEPDYEVMALEELQNNWVSVLPLEKSSLVPIYVYGDDPELTKAVGDKVIELLQKRMDEILAKQVETAQAYLKGQVDAYSERVAANAKSIAEFREKLGYGDPGEYISQTLTSITQLEQQKSLLESQLAGSQAAADAAWAEFQKIGTTTKLTREGESTSAQVQESMTNKLTMDLTDLRAQRAAMLLRLKPSAPQVQGLDAQIAEVEKQRNEAAEKESLKSETETTTENFTPQAQAAYNSWLEATINMTSTRARAIGIDTAIATLRASQSSAILVQSELEQMQRQAQIDLEQYSGNLELWTSYDAMLQAHRDGAPLFASMISVTPCSVLNEKDNDYPSMLLVGIIALALGVFFALLLPITYDYLNQIQHSARQAAAVPGIRVVAVVPHHGGSKMYQAPN